MTFSLAVEDNGTRKHSVVLTSQCLRDTGSMSDEDGQHDEGVREFSTLRPLKGHLAF